MQLTEQEYKFVKGATTKRKAQKKLCESYGFVDASFG
jgi:hypothetical protein